MLPDPFSPPFTLRNRHLQSVATQAPWRRRRIARLAGDLLDDARAEVLDCGDGVRLLGYYTPARGNERGLVVLLHGWEGSADSSYILSSGSALRQAGYAVFRLNLRDHGATQALNEGLFHSCRLDEVLGAVLRIRTNHPSPRFALVGQSLGGNFALRVATRAPSVGLEIDRVIAICPVLRPHSTMLALDSGWWPYRKYFLSRWRQSLMAKALAHPKLYDFGDLRRFRTLSDTTAYFVEHHTEFESLDAYLNGYSLTGPVLAGLDVSSRIILAEDDPIIPRDDLSAIAMPPALELSTTPYGGHCGFLDDFMAPSWVDREIVADLALLP